MTLHVELRRSGRPVSSAPLGPAGLLVGAMRGADLQLPRGSGAPMHLRPEGAGAQVSVAGRHRSLAPGESLRLGDVELRLLTAPLPSSGGDEALTERIVGGGETVFRAPAPPQSISRQRRSRWPQRLLPLVAVAIAGFALGRVTAPADAPSSPFPILQSASTPPSPPPQDAPATSFRVGRMEDAALQERAAQDASARAELDERRRQLHAQLSLCRLRRDPACQKRIGARLDALDGDSNEP